MHTLRNYGYRLKEDGEGWTWSILDESGEVKRQGQAATKAIAAACVIHQLLREREPDRRAA
jgi:hypothetical protein